MNVRTKLAAGALAAAALIPAGASMASASQAPLPQRGQSWASVPVPAGANKWFAVPGTSKVSLLGGLIRLPGFGYCTCNTMPPTR